MDTVMPRQVVRLDDLPSTKDFASRFVLRAEPVILGGAARDSNATVRWTFDYLRERVGHRVVHVAASATRTFHSEMERGHRRLELPIARVLDALTGGLDEGAYVYVQEQLIEEVLPELSDDLPDLAYAHDRSVIGRFFWCGADTRSPLHFDAFDNLFAQVSGNKRFLLFPPRDFDRLYPMGADTQHFNMSRVVIGESDVAEFPRLAEATIYEALLAPGDVLYLPAFWWHQVEALGVSLSVNTWMRCPIERALVPAMFRFLARPFEAIPPLESSIDLGAHGTLAGAALAALEAGFAGVAAALVAPTVHLLVEDGIDPARSFATQWQPLLDRARAGLRAGDPNAITRDEARSMLGAFVVLAEKLGAGPAGTAGEAS